VKAGAARADGSLLISHDRRAGACRIVSNGALHRRTPLSVHEQVDEDTLILIDR
jgi:hypothetical protein